MLGLLFVTTAALLPARIDAHYETAKVLQADFEQRTVSSATRVVKVEKGRFWMDRGRELLRFNYVDPESKVFLYRAGQVDFYIPADKQVTRYRIEESPDMSPLVFLLGKRRLSQCLVLATGAEAATTRGGQMLHLQAIAGGESPGDFYVEANASTGEVSRVVFFDDLKNRIEIRLSGQRSVDRLPADVEKLDLPAGTEVIDRH